MNIESSFDDIYRRHWKGMYYSAYKILKNKALCEDAVQEVFVSLWRRKDNSCPENIEGYLHQALRFQVYNILRNKKVKEEAWVNIMNECESIPAYETVETKELHRSVVSSIDSLPEKCRRIFKLRREEEMSVKEISHQLDLSPKTVEAQLTIAFRRLKVSLEHLTIW